jgi:hypothetical protein
MRGKGIGIGLLALGLVLGGLAACSSDGGDDEGGGSATEDSAHGATLDDDAAADGPLDEPLAAYADGTSEVYADPASWLCRPDVTDDVCDQDLDVTVVEADGTTSVESFAPADDAPVDCFYVYPTISRDESVNSDMQASDDEEGFAALNQVARLGSVCRVFAPIYRQTTLTGLGSALSGGGGGPSAEAGEIAYGDVLEAWQHYLAEDNGGRGVILVGHSQGSAHLSRLLEEEVDPDPEVRDRVVAAYLAGWGVDVPPGEVVGGTFQELPLCEADDQIGCVLSWASFRETAPPPEGAFFGRSRGNGEPAACTNPADLAGGVGGEQVELASIFPTDPDGGLLSSLGAGGDPQPYLDPEVGTIDTPFTATPGLVTGSCQETDGYAYLSVGVEGDPYDPRADDIGGDLTPTWGLHLVDVSLVMGDLVELAGSQVDAYVAERQ